MAEGFELLEEKVRRAADLVRRLRSENVELSRARDQLQARLQEAEKALSGASKQRGAAEDQGRRVEALTREVQGMREERDQVRQRIAQLVEVLDGLE